MTASPQATGLADARIPVALLTGYLGAGKTTLVNHILTADHGRRYAVLVNEFGEIGIDNDLILTSSEELFQMNNGCICCTVRGDLIRTLRDLLKQNSGLEGIIVETSGLADPGPIVQTFFVDQILAAQARLDSVTTVVDAHHILDQLTDSPEAAVQIGFADQVLLNKIDTVSDDELREIEMRLRRLNGEARIHRTERSETALVTILDRGGFDLDRIENAGHAAQPGHKHHSDQDCDGDHEHDSHDAGVTSVSLSVDRPVDAQRLQQWLEALLQIQGQNILRTKGIFDIAGEARKWVFQSVHMLLDGEFQHAWMDDDHRASRMVFIGRDLDAEELRRGLESCIVKH